jgi:hypothetical protein
MCAEYWNLRADVRCPVGHELSGDLQTHFTGDDGSSHYHYGLGERVKELEGITVTLDGRNDDFIGECTTCHAFYDYGAEIVEGKVIRLWNIPRP